jgi:hypothetical protein
LYRICDAFYSAILFSATDRFQVVDLQRKLNRDLHRILARVNNGKRPPWNGGMASNLGQPSVQKFGEIGSEFSASPHPDL